MADGVGSVAVEVAGDAAADAAVLVHHDAAIESAVTEAHDRGAKGGVDSTWVKGWAMSRRVLVPFRRQVARVRCGSPGGGSVNARGRMPSGMSRSNSSSGSSSSVAARMRALSPRTALKLWIVSANAVAGVLAR